MAFFELECGVDAAENEDTGLVHRYLIFGGLIGRKVQDATWATSAFRRSDGRLEELFPASYDCFSASKIEGLQLGWLGDDSLLVVIPVAYGEREY